MFTDPDSYGWKQSEQKSTRIRKLRENPVESYSPDTNFILEKSKPTKSPWLLHTININILILRIINSKSQWDLQKNRLDCFATLKCCFRLEYNTQNCLKGWASLLSCLEK